MILTRRNDIQTDGLLLIDKEEGSTSAGVVARVKKIFGGRRGPKVGHAGTLDPFATGLLIILVGGATRLSPFLMSIKKDYLGSVLLGIETDTLDPTGKTVRTCPVPEIGIEEIRQRAQGFIGLIEQRPPLFSALKHGGQRAYKLARRGKDFELEKRQVQIHSLEITSARMPLFSLAVSCSKGTYIRSLASDLAASLGTCGHLKMLRRISCGGFDVEDALRDELLGSIEKKDLVERLIPISRCLPHMDGFEVGGELAQRVRNGYQPMWKELAPLPEEASERNGYAKLTFGQELVAIISLKRGKREEHDQAHIKLERVFL